MNNLFLFVLFLGFYISSCKQEPEPLATTTVQNINSPEISISVVTDDSNNFFAEIKLLNKGNLAINSYGIVWDENIEKPEINLNSKIEINGSFADNISIPIINLKGSTTYNIRAYVNTSLGAIYSNNKNFIYTGEWKRITGLPNNAFYFYGFDLFNLSNTIFCNDGKKLWLYDTESDEWIQNSNLFYTNFNEKFSAPSTFTINDNAYLMNTDSSKFSEFNGKTFKWSKKANFIGESRKNAICFSLNGKGYAGLGQKINNLFLLSDDIYEYDPATDKWTYIGIFPGGKRREAVSFCIGNKGYVMGGKNSSGNELYDIWEFTPQNSNKWQKLGVSLPYFYDLRLAFVIDSSAYLFIDDVFIKFTPSNNTNILNIKDYLKKSILNSSNTGVKFGDKGMIIDNSRQTWLYDPKY